MSLDCPKSVNQLNSVKELQKQLTQEVVFFESINNSNTKKVEKIEKLTKIYKIRKDIRSGIGQIEYHIRPEYALAEKLKLKEQYKSQLKMLYDLKLLTYAEMKKEGVVVGIVGVDGKKHPLPSYEDILARLIDPEKRAFLEKKFEQGFTKLQLVPFALKLSSIINSYRETLIRIKKSGALRRTNGRRLGVNVDNPMSIALGFDAVDDVSDGSEILLRGDMEYEVNNYEGKTRELRGGKSKKELLKDPDIAWQVCLIEDLPDLPKEGKGKSKGGRKQLESGTKDVVRTAEIFFELLKCDEQYLGESGQTPEGAFMTWLTYLYEKNIVIDDYVSEGSKNWLVGTHYTCGIGDNDNQGVPIFSWDSLGNKAKIVCHDSLELDIVTSCRTTVKI